MGMIRTIGGAVLAAGLVLAASGAAAQPEEIGTGGPYVHEGSGMTLPVAVGAWRRIDVYRYDTLATDVSASYRLDQPNGSVLATTYVYPMPGGWTTDPTARAKACRAEYETRKNEVVTYYDDVQVLSEMDAQPPQGGDFDPGRWASFSYETEVSGRDQPVRSELYVFCYVGGPWAFEYRITRPADLEATKAIAAFMIGLAWTVEEGR
jgi:hypothetical protein